MGMEHYTKVKDLGGTNGAFLARDRHQLDRLVVIKRLAEGTQGLEELNAALRLRHPHVIRFLESFLFNNALYVVMDYEPGGDLEELFRYLTQRHKTPTTHTLLLWYVQLLEALTYCHEHHVIHRDIKPGNILVSEDTKVLYLGDFGSAKTLGTSNVTSTFVGSPLWISPEVLMGTQYSYAADIWSLGCVFYEMATLRKPFSAPSFAHLVQQITRGQIAPLPSSVAPEVKTLVHSMLRLKASERISAVEALAKAKAALAQAEARRQMTPPPMRSPLQPPASSSSSPLRGGGFRSPVEVPAPVAAVTPPPHPQLSSSSATSDRSAEESGDDGGGSAPPQPVSSNATASNSTTSTPPVTALTYEKPPPRSQDDGRGRRSAPQRGAVSPKAAAAKKRPVGGSGGGAAGSPSASTHSHTPTPTPPPAPANTDTLARNGVSAAAEDASAEEEAATESCAPQQMVLAFSTGAFRKPVARKKKAVGPTAAVRHNDRVSRPPASHQLQPPQQQRQRVAGVPVPTTAAPNYVRQSTGDVLASRRPPATTAAEALDSSDNPSHRGPHPNGHNLANSPQTKVVVKTAPPVQVPRRQKPAADNTEAEAHSVVASPPRRAPAAPPPLVGGAAKQAPAVLPPKPAAAAGAAKTAAAAPGAPGAGNQWMDQRMRELSAMENYLHQHRVDDNKVLQTYDARRNEEAMAVTPPRPSPAPRRSSPARSPGMLGRTPPTPPNPQQQRQRGGAATAESRGPGAASPFVRQASYARQASYTRQASYARQPSHTGIGGASEPRQGSLSSSYNGRQASNARPRPQASEAEQQRVEEERTAAREKREAERQRMKELIQEQRAAAKKEKRRPKKGSLNSAVEVDIILPDHKHYSENGTAAA